MSQQTNIGWFLIQAHKYLYSKVMTEPEVFYKKDVLKNFTKFTGPHLCQSLFFNNIRGLRPAA